MAFLLAILCFYLTLVSAKYVSYHWDISWIQANPDNRLSRPVIAINGQWPPPTIRVSVGDTLSINVHNKLGNETTGIHCHGIVQNGTNQMDGPAQVVACPIPPGASYKYEFQINQAGTYWYHSHADGQYMDGLRGPLIVHDPQSPYLNDYDEEIVLPLSDWYHDQQPILEKCYLSTTCTPDGAEPVPYSALMRDGIGPKFAIQAGKTYFVRIINMAAFAQMYLNFADHDVTIIEVDGVYTQRQEVQSLYLANGQRYGVLLKAKNTSSKNYAITASMDVDAFDNVPSYVHQNVTGYLVYDEASSLPVDYTVPFFNVTDDMTLIPWDKQPLLKEPTQKVNLSLGFFTAWNQNRAGFNGKTYLPPKVPTLYSVLSAPDSEINDSTIYGNYTNAHVLNYGDVIEVTIVNTDDGPHPLHIHGHQVQIVERTPGKKSDSRKVKRHGGKKTWSIQTTLRSTDLGGPSYAYAPAPMRRDTWTIAARGTTVIRFVADNPGVWFFHCHMEWHLSAGLATVFIEAPSQLQAAQKSIDPAMQQICKSQNVPLSGNAAGNTRDWLDLTGQTEMPSNRSDCLKPMG